MTTTIFAASCWTILGAAVISGALDVYEILDEGRWRRALAGLRRTP
jgi:hypothetical protein